MSNTTSIAKIREAIEFLENEQEVKGQQLRQQFQETYESLKPINLLKSAVIDISSKPLLTAKIFGVTTGVGLGILAKKIVIGASGNIVRNIFGTLLQFGVTNLIARQSTGIKSIGQFVKKSVFGRRKVNTDKQ